MLGGSGGGIGCSLLSNVWGCLGLSAARADGPALLLDDTACRPSAR